MKYAKNYSICYYEFINDSDNCYDNGELSILYMVVYHVSELYDYVE